MKNLNLEQEFDLTAETGQDTAHRCSVLVPRAVNQAFDYLSPTPLSIGQVVEVPFRNKTLIGVVWEPSDCEPSGHTKNKKLKTISAICECPPLPQETIDFVKWVAAYSVSPIGAVLKMVIPSSKAVWPPDSIETYRLSDAASKALKTGQALSGGLRLTPARQAVFDTLSHHPNQTSAELRGASKVSSAVIQGLLKKGALVTESRNPEDTEIALPVIPPDAKVELTTQQADVINALRKSLDEERFSATLIDGVTGAGKTEVYFEAIAHSLKQNPDSQVLVLLPEIALSNQWVRRFEDRFGFPPHLWHSHLNPNQRAKTWRAVIRGRAQVIVGARSALFLPFQNLKFIVVDEEHDTSFKQEEGVVYHARDMAVVRAHIAKCPITLASATPSLESVANVARNKYRSCILPARATGAQLPKVHIIDLRAKDEEETKKKEQNTQEKQRITKKPTTPRWISQTLASAIDARLEAGQQSLLFLNRRGYAPLSLCQACGHRIECPACTASMVFHKFHNRLLCHQCGHTMTAPKSCPSCGSIDSLAAIGPGVERLAEEAVQRFPSARMEIMSSDTLTSQSVADKLFRRVANNEIDILIGTQVVGKGHHFPHLTLVGVIDADTGLDGSDPRAAERTYQVLHQVAGRAGREKIPGEVFLQTFTPDHPVMEALASMDRDAFVTTELAMRKAAKLPPYAKLVSVIISGAQESTALKTAQLLMRASPNIDGIDIFGPAPAPMARLRGKFRFRLLVRGDLHVDLQKVMRAWFKPLEWPSSVKVQIDVDPYNFM